MSFEEWWKTNITAMSQDGTSSGEMIRAAYKAGMLRAAEIVA